MRPSTIITTARARSKSRKTILCGFVVSCLGKGGAEACNSRKGEGDQRPEGFRRFAFRPYFLILVLSVEEFRPSSFAARF